MKPPQNVSFLERAIRGFVDSNKEAHHLRVCLANVVLGQFLRDCVARGGTSMKLRYGPDTTRFTIDFDVACRNNREEFIAALARRLEAGWSEFTGFVVTLPTPHPGDVPPEYVMHPFDIKLQYRHHPWCTVRFEVSYNEIGDADEQDLIPVPADLIALFEQLGLPLPQPIPAMTIPYQIAQKLHGLTAAKSQRVQDLVDLQLMVDHEDVDWAKTKSICRRLFANRRQQSWPPVVVKGPEWDTLYVNSSFGLKGVRIVDEAIVWANEVIELIERS